MNTAAAKDTKPMPKPETLTPKQEAICEEVAQEFIDAITKPRRLTKRVIDAWLKVVYGLYKLPIPKRVEIAKSPEAALALANELTNEKRADTDYCGMGDGGWVSFYEAFLRVGVLKETEEGDVIALRDFCLAAYDTVLLDECAIVIQRPKVLKLDDDGNLHCTNGPALEWADGEKDFAYHGQWVSERVVMSPRSFTRDEYLALTNTEERRALSEIAGWDWVAKLLGAASVDTWTDPGTGLAYELLRCSDGQQLLRKQSPKLANGSQPTYMEPVHENLKTARAARKWQATNLTAEQCEADSDLTYGVEA